MEHGETYFYPHFYLRFYPRFLFNADGFV